MTVDTSFMGFGRLYQQIKNIYHLFQAHVWRLFYGMPDKRMKIYGITGTGGKTTTAYILATILREQFGKEKVGMLSTELFWIGEKEETNETHMTSLNARSVYRYLQEMKRSGVQHVALEMTSHALDQNRLAGLQLAGAIITNLSHEHLDYHKTMEAYAAAKKRIVEYLVPGGVLVGNGSNKWVQKMLDSVDVPVVRFTAEEAKEVEIPLPGDFNKENALAAIRLAETLNIPAETIQKGVASVERIPGRLEWLKTPWGARILVDFALTPDALERLYIYVKGESPQKIIGVFGGAGRRDRTKRPKMAAIVAKYADEIILTQDEPYDDPEEQIYTDLEAGLQDTTTPWQRIPDRRDALEYVIQKSKDGDVVVVTGMGNFHYRVVGDKKVPWNDKSVIIQIIEEQASSHDAK